MTTSTLRTITLLALFVLLCWNCENKKTTALNKTEKGLKVWADTIIYEVLISNPDTLNEWENLKIKDVNQIKLVDDLFNMIYTGEKTAYHYYTNKAMSIDEIRELENTGTFSREKVGKLQFTESWIYNQESKTFEKHIQSILLAFELYDNSNNLRGYKAAFYLKDF